MVQDSGPAVGDRHPQAGMAAGYSGPPPANLASAASGPGGWAGLRRRMPLATLIGQRLVLSAVLLWAVSVVVFLGIEALPGDFSQTYLGQSATPQAVANIRAELGLDRPALTRYVDWLGGVVQGDFGNSWASGTSVTEQIALRLGNTLFLAFWAALVSVPLAVGLGMLAVHFRNRWPDRLINVISLGAISLPEFFVGYILILFIAVQGGWVTFPSTVYAGMSFGQRLEAIVLPCATLVLVVLAVGTAFVAQIIDFAIGWAISGDVIHGLIGEERHRKTRATIEKHGVALNLAYLVVGVVVVEVVFVYPGMGQYMVDAVTVRDMPVVQACGLIFAAVYILLNMTADILGILANPRPRHPR